MGDETNDVNVGQISTPEKLDNVGEPGTPNTVIGEGEGDGGVDENQGTIGIPTRSNAVVPGEDATGEEPSMAGQGDEEPLTARRSRKSSRKAKKSRKEKKSRNDRKDRKERKSRKH